MSLWQVITALVLIGGAAYTYVFQPMALELGLPRAQCWWEGGTYLRATAKESGYSALMSQMPENQVRLKQGDAVGCFNEGQCVQTPNEALGAIESQMMTWTAAAGGNLIKGNIMNMIGMRAEDDARARQSEAEYCVQYLGEKRRLILEKAQEPKASKP